MLDITTFQEYKRQLSDQRIVLLSQKERDKFKVIKPADFSRYFHNGRRKIRGKIFKRLGGWSNCSGVMISLTFNPALYTQEEAWYYLGKLRRQFMDKVNHWRKYHGYVKARACSVIEVQKQTGYPHVHLIFPHLKYLAPKKEMLRAWGMESEASIDWTYRDNMSPTSYMLKYITKMDTWDDRSQNYCWLFGTRLYSMSLDYTLPDYAEKRVPEWKFYAIDSTIGLSWWWISGKHLLQRVREGPAPYPLQAFDYSQVPESELC